MAKSVAILGLLFAGYSDLSRSGVNQLRNWSRSPALAFRGAPKLL